MRSDGKDEFDLVEATQVRTLAVNLNWRTISLTFDATLREHWITQPTNLDREVETVD